eukprot:9471043-Pyramimonas_sp.AAC.1
MARAVAQYVEEAFNLCDPDDLDSSELPDELSAFFQALDLYAADTAEGQSEIALDFAGFSSKGPRDTRFDRPLE